MGIVSAAVSRLTSMRGKMVEGAKGEVSPDSHWAFQPWQFHSMGGTCPGVSKELLIVGVGLDQLIILTKISFEVVHVLKPKEI